MAKHDEDTIRATIAAAPPAADRTAAIAAGDARGRQLVPIGGAYREIPVLSVPQACLVYRAANGRIVTELEEHFTKAGGSIAALHADEAGAETQALLHRLLVAKAANTAGPVMQELARHGQQTEPLLITADGVLVNGNRRLAAMRELLARDPKRYAGFARVEAGVLPEDVTEQDIEFIEASLQMAPEVKLAYGWINRRMKLRHQRETLGLPAEAIASAYRIEDPDRIEAEIDELRLAEAYLQAFKGALEYSLIAEDEALFRGLKAQLDALPADLRDAWQTAGFAMIDGRKSVDGAIERFFPFAAPTPSMLAGWTIRRLAEEDGIAPLPDGERTTTRNIELNDEIIGHFTAKLGDRARAGEHAASLFGLMERLRAEHVDARAPHNAIKLVGRARAAIATIEVGRMTPKQLRQLRSEMIALEAGIATLLGEEPAIPHTQPPQPGILKRIFGSE